MLVALLLLLIFTLRTTVVSIVVSMVFINNPGVMANNTRMMITRLLFFMTIGLGHILALLNIGNIYNYFIINIALFMLLFHRDLVALLVLLVMTMRAIMLLVLNMSMVFMAWISSHTTRRWPWPGLTGCRSTTGSPTSVTRSRRRREKSCGVALISMVMATCHWQRLPRVFEMFSILETYLTAGQPSTELSTLPGMFILALTLMEMIIFSSLSSGYFFMQ